jgi:hypothetical protein
MGDKDRQETTQPVRAGKTNAVPPRESSPELLYQFSAARKITVREAIDLSEKGALRDGSFCPPRD